MINETPPPASVIPKVLVVWYGMARCGVVRCGIELSIRCECVFIIAYITISSHSTLSLKISSVTHTHITHATLNLGVLCLARTLQRPKLLRLSFNLLFLLLTTTKFFSLFCMRLVFPICLLFVVD